MEEKKKIIIAILTKLEPYRLFANKLLVSIQKDFFSEEMIDMIVKKLLTIAKITKDAISVGNAKQYQELLVYIKKNEQKERQKEEGDLDCLLSSV